MRIHLRKMTLLVAVCVVAMMAAGPAFAQDEGYLTGGENVAGNVQGQDQGGAGTAGTVSSGGGSALPFTGLDIALILGVGGVLLAVGLGTRRLTRQNTV
jgi:hypothetical protein